MAWYDYLAMLSPVAAIGGLAAGRAPQIGQAAQNLGLAGTPARTQNVPLFQPNQVNALNQFLQAGLGGLNQLGQLGQQQFRVPTPSIAQLFNQTMNQSQAGFAPIAAEARRQFPQQISQLAERFTALGPSAQRSSAFQGALGSAASGLESQLAALGAQFGQNQQSLNQSLLGQLLGSQAQQFGQTGNLFMNLANLGLTPQFQAVNYPRVPGAIESLFTPLAQGAGYALPGLARGGF